MSDLTLTERTHIRAIRATLVQYELTGGTAQLATVIAYAGRELAYGFGVHDIATPITERADVETVERMRREMGSQD